jgi:hypothetical protein
VIDARLVGMIEVASDAMTPPTVRRGPWVAIPVTLRDVVPRS